MQAFIKKYLNEIVSLAVMAMMIVALVSTQVHGYVPGAGAADDGRALGPIATEYAPR